MCLLFLLLLLCEFFVRICFYRLQLREGPIFQEVVPEIVWGNLADSLKSLKPLSSLPR